MITQHNSPQKLSGAVQKTGHPKRKTLDNTRVVASTCAPEKGSDMTKSAMKSNCGPMTRSRVKRVYGWHG